METQDPNKKPGPGRPRGRPKGSPNKKLSDSLIERINLRFPGFDPILSMIEDALDESNTPDLRFRAKAEVASYMYPKKKAIEHSADDGATFQVVLKQYNNAANDN